MQKIATKRLVPAVLVVFFLLLGIQAVSGQASQPQLPHTFWGTVYIGETPAAQGVEVIAVGPGVISGVPGNPVKTLSGGVYGETGMSSQKLLVQGDIEPGTPVEFYVGGVRADINPASTPGVWKTNYSYLPGEDTQANLRIAVQVSTSQTREPTPTQTRLPSSAVEAFLPKTTATYQPVSQPTGTGTAAVTAITTGTTRASTTSVGVTAVPSSPAGPSGTNVPAGTDLSGSGLVIGIVIVILIIIVVAAYAFMRKKGQGGTAPDEKQQEEEKK